MNWSNKKSRDPVQLSLHVQVDSVAMQKFWQFVELAKGEVSALGLVEEIRDESTGLITSLLVNDFLLVKQTCSMDETTIDAASVAGLIMDLEAQGIDSRKLKCWAHSHGGMSVFWSGTDDECIAGLANGEYLLSLVVNKKRDTQMRLDQFHPAHLYLTDVAFEIAYPMQDGLAAECLAEFKAKVTESSYAVSTSMALPMQELQEAHERGALTDEELRDELDWLGYEREELDEHPF
jgi:hypothetical protein